MNITQTVARYVRCCMEFVLRGYCGKQNREAGCKFVINDLEGRLSGGLHAQAAVSESPKQQEIAALRAQLEQAQAKANELQTELEEGDYWMKRAKSFEESGGCPICFCSDEEGHKPGEICHEWITAAEHAQAEAAAMRTALENCITFLKTQPMAIQIRDYVDALAPGAGKALLDKMKVLEQALFSSCVDHSDHCCPNDFDFVAWEKCATCPAKQPETRYNIERDASCWRDYYIGRASGTQVQSNPEPFRDGIERFLQDKKATLARLEQKPPARTEEVAAYREGLIDEVRADIARLELILGVAVE